VSKGVYFAPILLQPIDEGWFLCYNPLTETTKEASSMGETPRKPNVNIALLAHV